MKPKYNNSKFRTPSAGASLVTAIVICFSGSAFATTWEGDVSTDWNNDLNWSGDAGTVGTNATINTNVPNIATINADIPANPVDIFVGTGAGTLADPIKVNHNAGLASTGANNWMFVGRAGGVGVYNMADTTTVVPANASGFGPGTGSLNVGAGGPGGRLYIGGNNGTGSNGTFNMNTSGTLEVRNQMEIGTNASSGTLNLDGGTINVGTAGGDGDWFEIGNGASCFGTVNMTGGTINKSGTEHFIVGANGATGILNFSGGTISVNNEFWVGNNAGSNGTFTFSAGTLNVGSWVAIGRGSDTAVGTVNMTGGTWNKTGGGSQFIVGANGSGTMNMSGGLVDVQGGFTWIGEAANASTAVLTISGSAEFRTPTMSVGQSAPNAILNLDGGTLRTLRINGAREQNDTGATGGTGTVNFNGTQIIATGANTVNFISTTLDNAVIGAGNLRVDSNGFDLSVPKELTGSGGIVKSGVGVLTLTGVSTYSGSNVVNGGSLVLSTAGTGGGSITLANGTTLGVNAQFVTAQLVASAATFGTNGPTTLNLDLSDVSGVNPTNSLLSVTGALAVNGVVTVNVAGAKFAVGDMPLLSYDATLRTGTGSFVLGSLPNGVVGTIQVDPNYFGPNQGLVYLDIDSVALPKWNGNVDAIWTTPNNWTDQVTLLPTSYVDGNPVLFNDDATGTTNVVLNSIVTPSSVLFENDVLTYSLTGTGAISGDTGLTKRGSQPLTITGISNTYTGVTRLEGGTTSVAVLTNGGVASPLGAAASAPANLALAGGTLDYTGGAVSIDRGIAIAAADNTIVSGLNLASDLTISGGITATLGKLLKTGPGVLTLTNPGANVLGNGSAGDGIPQSFSLAEGALVLNSAGQTNTVFGRTGFGTGDGFTTSVLLTNGATFTGNGRTLVGVAPGATTTLTVSGTSSMQLNDAFQISMTPTSVGNVIIEDSGSITKTGGWLSIGNDGVGTMTVRDSGTLTANGDFNVSDVGVSTGTLSIEDVATVSATGPVFIGKNTGTSGTLNVSGGTFNSTGSYYVASATGSLGAVNVTGGLINHTGGEIMIGRNGAGTWTQSAGTVNANGWTILGRDLTGTGTMNISGGSFTQTQLDRPFMIGEFGIGILNVSGTAQVTSLGNNGLILANEPAGTGTVNLNGGTLTVKRVREGNDGNAGVGGTSTFNFNGGTLVAGAGANANFMSGLNTAVINPGGAYIDTNGQTVGISQVLDDGGGDLHKVGTGTLQLNGASNFLGTTFVDAGTLGGTGSVSGPLVVAAGASINPGVSAGTFTVGDAATINGTYVAEIDGATSDTLAVAGALTIGAGAVLDFNQLSAPAAAGFVIATYSSLSGTFTTVNNLPPGFTLNYGANQITLSGAATPYTAWAASFGLDPFTDGAPGVDKDTDGQSNGVEFALGGSPISGSNNAKIYNLVADSSDGDALEELLMTIAVRTGTPAFAGSPSPTATHEGFTYTIEGSTTLDSFTTGVTPVAPVTTGLPAAPAGYEYRTFSLDGSNGVPGTGFLRVQVNF